MSLASHIMLRLVDDRVVLPTTAARRAAAAIVLAIGRRYGLLGFRAADTHLHILAACERAAAGKLTHAVEVALRLRLRIAVAFAPAHIKPIVDQHHLHRALRYILCQAERHELQSDPFHEASSLPDLVGLRVVDPSLAPRVARSLPRFRPRGLAIELNLLPDDDAPQFVPERADLDGLADAAAAAIAVPELTRRGLLCNEVRRAAVGVVDEAAVDPLAAWALGALIGCSARTVERLRQRPVDPRLAWAVSGQLRMRTAWRRRHARAIPGLPGTDGLDWELVSS